MHTQNTFAPILCASLIQTLTSLNDFCHKSQNKRGLIKNRYLICGDIIEFAPRVTKLSANFYIHRDTSMTVKQAIAEFDLLLIANQIIQEHDDYIEGMRADSVSEKDDVLVFKGEYFLDSNGLPTANTTAVFNMFKYLAHHLSKEFTLKT